MSGIQVFLAEKGSDSEERKLLSSHKYSTNASYNSNYAISSGQSKTVNEPQDRSQDVKLTHAASSYETASKSSIQSPTNSCSIEAADGKDQLPLQEVCYHLTR